MIRKIITAGRWVVRYGGDAVRIQFFSLLSRRDRTLTRVIRQAGLRKCAAICALLWPWRSEWRERIRGQVADAFLLDAGWYAEKHRDSIPPGDLPVRHFVFVGWHNGWSPNPLIDSEWFLSRNRDVAAAGLSAAEFALLFGNSGRAPHSLFDAAWYLEANPDVRTAGISPLVHYMTEGARQGRNPHPLFDTRYYLESNPDVDPERINPLTHFVQHGLAEGRNSHPLFDAAWYLQVNPDLAAAGVNPLQHYLTCGELEGREPHPLFDAQYYLQTYPDVTRGLDDPLAHFIKTGGAEGRDPNPLFNITNYAKDAALVRGPGTLIDYMRYQSSSVPIPADRLRFRPEPRGSLLPNSLDADSVDSRHE